MKTIHITTAITLGTCNVKDRTELCKENMGKVI